ncbi:cytoskeletal protein RodZ [Bacillus sp. SORGH_AS 510]|uniref:DUF6241 domain-containing protein n=1 Tax=Bacillus sp. SORGH_AS_0510 TaxID=3041771 RepID=UPI0027800361|nr:DUF6241 domain-containing protein [Bacillus sp. SORGH_AS_0510]MDQ1143917.1 cytoskeletal protein RodZ [Bacillus sp. SORGH_AS_0510]
MNLHNMKQKMDQGSFGDIHFTENEKAKVLNQIYNKKVSKTRKPLINFISVAASSILVIGLGYLSFGNQIKNDTQKIRSTEAAPTKAVTPAHEVPKVSQAEVDRAASNFNQMKNFETNDDFFYYSMITMALQKLEFKGEENYRIPATSENIKRIQINRANLQYLKNKAVELHASEPYQEILEKWLNGDFSAIENDYLSIRNIKGDPTQQSESPVLKVRTAEEEKKYIEHFFGSEGLQVDNRDWQ